MIYAGHVFQPKVRVYARRWYVVGTKVEGGCSGNVYLHKDGAWRGSTVGDDGSLTGLFDTEAEAKAALGKVLGGTTLTSAFQKAGLT